MKKLLITTALVSAIAGTASAQMVFQTGQVDFTYYDLGFGPDLSTFELAGRADFDVGQMGLQLDGGVSILTDFSESVESYAVGVHVYKPLYWVAKVGGYAGYDLLSDSGGSDGIINFGVEGMASLGAVDVEASIGGHKFDGAPEYYWMATLHAYYEVSDSVELSAGIDHFFYDTSTLTDYRLGVAYTLPNMPLTIGAEYSAMDGNDSFGIVASYAFGPASDERLFRSSEHLSLLASRISRRFHPAGRSL